MTFWKKKKEPEFRIVTKASEYAALVKILPPMFSVERDQGPCRVTRVTGMGGLELYGGKYQVLTPKEALALADWIYDTFGEAECGEGDK